MGVESPEIETNRALRSLVALLAADRDDRAEHEAIRRSEVALGEAGFSAKEIAALTGKNAEAVRSKLRRTPGLKGSQ